MNIERKMKGEEARTVEGEAIVVVRKEGNKGKEDIVRGESRKWRGLERRKI